MKSILLFFAISGVAIAHQSTVTDDGKRMFLANPNVALELKNKPSYLSSTEASSIVRETLDNWNQLQTNLHFNMGTSSTHQIRFENDFSRYGSSVVGITEVNYNKEGAIQKATIKLNNNVYFSLDKSAHVLSGVYLGDVLAHEVGHLIGLGHSEVLEATMFFESFPGQHSLSKDDISGVRSLYSSGWGKITGTIMGGKHIPVLGAQVKAISRSNGEAISTVSNEDGRFEIRGLDLNDSYYLYVSPTVKVDDLPPYYANTQSNFCPTTYQGGFYTACGVNDAGSAQAVTLTGNRRSVDVGIVSISCGLRSSPEYARSKLEEDSEPLFIWDSLSENSNEKNHIGYFFKSEDWSKWDKFKVDLSHTPHSGDKVLRVGFISYVFGNLLEYELKIFRNNIEVAVLGMSEDPVTRTYSNNIFYDLPLSHAPGSNEFEIHIRARNLTPDCNEPFCSGWTYPALKQFLAHQQHPYLLSLGLVQGLSPLFNTEQGLSDNSSCLDGPFTYSVKRNAVNVEEIKKQDNGGQLSCATIEPPSSGPPGGGLMSLCFGFMLASLTLLLKKTKKTLS